MSETSLEQNTEQSLRETIRVCDSCGKGIIVNQNNLKRTDAYDENGNYYILMYVVCSDCNNSIVVQIDDVRTRAIFNDLRDLTLKAIQKRIKHETVSPKANKRSEKLTKKLKAMRKELEKKCNGKEMYDKDKNIIINSLTFPDRGDIIESNL